MKFCYAYVHGFASGPTSYKGVLLRIGLFLRDRIAKETGQELLLLNVNGGEDFRSLTLSDAVKEIGRVDEEKRTEIGHDFKWRLIGSSLGGHAILLFAQQYPDRVDRVVSLCPAFRLRQIFENLVGPVELEEWKTTGVRLWPKSSNGIEVPVSFNFMIDAAKHSDFPNPPHDILIIHGKSDEVVPIETSYQFVQENPEHRAIKCLEDDHALSSSNTLESIYRFTFDFLFT